MATCRLVVFGTVGQDPKEFVQEIYEIDTDAVSYSASIIGDWIIAAMAKPETTRIVVKKVNP